MATTDLETMARLRAQVQEFARDEGWMLNHMVDRLLAGTAIPRAACRVVLPAGVLPDMTTWYGIPIVHADVDEPMVAVRFPRP